MSNSLAATSFQNQKEVNIKQNQHQQQYQQQFEGTSNVKNQNCLNYSSTIQSNQGQQTLFIPQSQINTSNQSTQSPLFNISKQHQQKVSQKPQLKVPPPQQTTANISQFANQQSSTQSQSQSSSQPKIVDNSQEQSLLAQNQQLPNLISQLLQSQLPNQKSKSKQQQKSTSSLSSSSSLCSPQPQFSCQNSIQNFICNQANQSFSNQNNQAIESMKINYKSGNNNQNQQSVQINSTQNGIICNSNGSVKGNQCVSSSTNNSNTSILIKKGQGKIMNEENGICFTQKQKLLQIIQKQQREQQQFEKKQQLASSVVNPQPVAIYQKTLDEIMSEIARNHKRQNTLIKPLKLITSPKTKNKCSSIRNLLRKYQRNVTRDEDLINSNAQANSFTDCLIQIQQQQQNNILICNSPINRPTNGMQKNQQFLMKASNQNNKTKLNQQQSQLFQKEETITKEDQEADQIEESLSDYFYEYNNKLDDDDLQFIQEIELACKSQQQNKVVHEKVLSNKNLNLQVFGTYSSQQLSSQCLSPLKINNNSKQNQSASILSLHSKENDLPRLKESNFKQIAKSNQQKQVVSQMMNQIENSFEKKDKSSNSEYLQYLEIEDSLASTHLSAISEFTSHSISQNILTLFSPNSTANSTINFNNTNNSLKQAISSLSNINGENNSQNFEQIKNQIDSQNYQQKQKQQLKIELNEISNDIEDINEVKKDQVLKIQLENII